MIIGEKKIFAVEFYALLDTIPPFGKICYWVAGETYGDIELISTLGLLFVGLNTEKQNTKLFLKKNIQQEGLDKKDFDDISVQIFHNKSGAGNYEYNGYPLTVDAAESFDGYHVFLLQDVQKTLGLLQRILKNRDFVVLMLISMIFKMSFASSPIKFRLSWIGIINRFL